MHGVAVGVAQGTQVGVGVGQGTQAGVGVGQGQHPAGQLTVGEAVEVGAVPVAPPLSMRHRHPGRRKTMLAVTTKRIHIATLFFIILPVLSVYHQFITFFSNRKGFLVILSFVKVRENLENPKRWSRRPPFLFNH